MLMHVPSFSPYRTGAAAMKRIVHGATYDTALSTRIGVRQGWLRHSAAVKRTAKEGEPNGWNKGEVDGGGGLVGAPPRSWRRQVRRRATCATLLGEAKAASSQPAAAGRTTGAAGTGAQRHGGAVVGMAGSGLVGRGGGAQGAQQRRPRRRDCAAEG